MCVVLIGMTGTGKSATGNSILSVDSTFSEQRPFESFSNPESITGESEAATGNVFEQRLTIVDTPGFKDTNRSVEEIANEILSAMLLVAPGPHIILICINATRMTSDVIGALDDIRRVLGTKFEKFAILVFTGRDSLEFDSMSIETFIQKMKPEYKNLLQSCGNRYVAFNNRLMVQNPSKNNKQVESLFQKMQKLRAELKNTRYSDSCFTDVRFKRAQQLLEAERERQARENPERTLVETTLLGKLILPILRIDPFTLSNILKTKEGKMLKREVMMAMRSAALKRQGSCCEIL